MRPRWKDYAVAVYCLAVDWIGAFGRLYRETHPGFGSWLGEKAQMTCHVAHNNRFYRWLDYDPTEHDFATAEIEANEDEKASLRRARQQTERGEVRWLDDGETMDDVIG